MRRRLLALGGVLLVLLLAACSSSSGAATNGSGSSGSTAAAASLRLGYLGNVTHAPAIVGVQKGLFQQRLGATKLETSTYNAGGDAISALLAGSIDAAFVGPNPAINGYQKSNGTALRIVAGSTSGGAGLVVKPSIKSVADLKGKKLATPQLGNTQDVALRAYLKQNGLNTDTSGGGDVSIVPQANADTLTAFEQGTIDGAWEPQPWVARLVQEGGGQELVNEKTLWPNGQFVTTLLVVAKSYLDAHPDAVKALIEGESDAIAAINANPTDAQKVVNDGLTAVAGKPLKDAVIQASFADLQFTLDPIASSLQKAAKDANDVGLLKSTDVANIYDLTILNQVLAAAGQPAVKGLS